MAHPKIRSRGMGDSLGATQFSGHNPDDTPVLPSKPQTNREAWAVLEELDDRRLDSWTRRYDWEAACDELSTFCTREKAKQHSIVARRRIEYLEVPEPAPALEDFVPEHLHRCDEAAALEIYIDVDRAFQAAQLAYAERKNARIGELQQARADLEAIESAERAKRLERQSECWPAGTVLDSQIRDIDGIEDQVDAQNDALEVLEQRMSSLLVHGVQELLLSRPEEGCTQTSDPREVAVSVEKSILQIVASVETYVGWTLPAGIRVAYTPESRQAIVEFDLPSVEIISTVKAYRYVKTREKVIETPRPSSKIKALYASVIQQLTLLVVASTFSGCSLVDVVVFNGMVNTVDPRTGRSVRPCLITLRVTRETFDELHLDRVDSGSCLKYLSAGVSKNPIELVPVKPVLEFSMVDPRFISETDAISALESRPNLLEMKPTDFEGLIQNLFTKMGLEARQTRPSRDGGVDCIAYDTRPIFGGKIVIQAKRYKNTVGVSAVRDLFGTLQNEGASKGILVTTSGYGQASFEFAKNKPIELIDGSNLLYLLAEYAAMEARIEPPEDWCDPVEDSPHLNGID